MAWGIFWQSNQEIAKRKTRARASSRCHQKLLERNPTPSPATWLVLQTNKSILPCASIANWSCSSSAITPSDCVANCTTTTVPNPQPHTYANYTASRLTISDLLFWAAQTSSPNTESSTSSTRRLIPSITQSLKSKRCARSAKFTLEPGSRPNVYSNPELKSNPCPTLPSRSPYPPTCSPHSQHRKRPLTKEITSQRAGVVIDDHRLIPCRASSSRIYRSYQTNKIRANK